MSDPNNPYGDQPSNDNPYGTTPGGPNPYGAPTPPPAPPSAPQVNPTSQGGYGAYVPPPPGAPGMPPFGQSELPPKTDGVSIASLVSGILGCCTGIGFLVAIILGIIGINRTKDGRKGRGLAIAGLVIGILGLILSIVGVLVTVLIAKHITVTPSNAEVGWCVSIDEHNDNGTPKVVMIRTPCGDDHDGQVVGVGAITAANLALKDDPIQLCGSIISAADKAKISASPAAGSLKLNMVAKDPNNLRVGDRIVCYITGDNLSSDLLK